MYARERNVERNERQLLNDDAHLFQKWRAGLGNVGDFFRRQFPFPAERHGVRFANGGKRILFGRLIIRLRVGVEKGRREVRDGQLEEAEKFRRLRSDVDGQIFEFEQQVIPAGREMLFQQVEIFFDAATESGWFPAIPIGHAPLQFGPGGHGAARIADQVNNFPTVRHGIAGKSRRRIGGGEGDEIFDRQFDGLDQIDGERSAELGQHLRLVAQGRPLVILALVVDTSVEFHVIGPVDEPDVVVGKVAAEQERDVFGHGLERIENAGRTGDEFAQE